MLFALPTAYACVCFNTIHRSSPVSAEYHPVGVPLILCVFVPSNSESDITLSIITLMLPAFPDPPLQMMPILSSACMVYPGSEDGSLNSISVIVAGMSER